MQEISNKGNIADMLTIMLILGGALIVMIVFILFVNKVNASINSDPTIPSQGKIFISNIQSQNGWTLDFIFIMALISLPLVSAMLAYFNNIPPVFFWASIGVLMMVIIIANIISDAYVNILVVDDVRTITSSIPMTNFVMTHFVIYAFISSVIILLGVFMKPKNVAGYAP